MSFKTQLMLRIFEPFLFYSMLKFLFRNPKLPIKLVLIIVAALLVPIWLLVLTALRLFRNFLGLLLYYKHGDKFISFMHGLDRVFSLFPNTDQGSTNIIYLTNFEGSGDDFYNITSKSLFNEFTDQKFNCLRKQFLGYYYYLKYDMAKEDVIKELPIKVKNMVDCMEFMEHQEYPCNGEAMLLYYIGKERVKSAQGNWCYPVLLKMHHSLGDGISIMRYLSKTSTNNDNYMKNLRIPENTTWHKAAGFFKCMKTSHFDICRLLTTPDDVFSTKHSGQKHYVLWTEPKPDVLDKMRQIRKLLNDGTSTMMIMSTALSKAFEEYYDLKALKKPDYLNLSFTILSEISKSKFSEFTNSFGVNDLKMPINFNRNIVDRLKQMYMDNFQSPTMNYKLSEWCTKVAYSILPNSLVKILMMRVYNSVFLSNLPGNEEEFEYDFTKIEDLHYWLTNVCEAGIGIATYSYARRLNVSFKVDKSVIPEFEDAHRLCHSMMDNIYKLYDECLTNMKDSSTTKTVQIDSKKEI